jgi:hypothetical protein
MPWVRSDSNRANSLVRASGLLAETMPRQAINTTLLPTSGDFRYGLIYLYAGEVVTNFHCHLTVNAASITTAKGGLYVGAAGGAQVAATANTTGAPLTNGVNTIITIAFASPYTVTATGPFYVGLFCDATTPPTLSSGRSATGLGASFGTGIVPQGNTAGLSDLPATITPATSGTFAWFAVS